MMEADPFRDWSPVRFWLFHYYLRFLFWRRFHKVMISQTGMPTVPPDRPLIIYANHPSWWDPALFMLLAPKLFPGRRGFGPMDRTALERYGLFRRFGVFGIDLETKRGAAYFLRTCLSAFTDKSAMLFITAEGHFVDSRRRPVRLRPGIAHLARKVPNVVLLPMALDYPFWNESRPLSLVRFGRALAGDPSVSTAQWTDRLEAALTENLDALAAEGMTRDPKHFRAVMSGASGGGRYDVIRRAVMWFGRRDVDPRHGQDLPAGEDGT